MNGKLPDAKIDWSRVDAHVIQPEEYEELPEWTEEMFDAAEIRDDDNLVRHGRFVETNHTTGNGLQTRTVDAMHDWAKSRDSSEEPPPSTVAALSRGRAKSPLLLQEKGLG